MVPAVESVKQAVDGVLSLIDERSDDIERGRRLPDEIVRAIRGTGVNRLALPVSLGGFEAPVIDIVDVLERISAVDGSTGWCAAIGAGTNLFAGYIDDGAAKVVFGDPDQGSAGMFGPYGTLVRDGDRHLLTGRWPLVSNCLHSEWIGLGAFNDDDPLREGRVLRVTFVRVADVTIEHTWDSLGLRGTGSHHVSATMLEVDLDRSFTFAGRPWPEGTLWRLPVYTVGFPMLVAVPLGIARGALDEISRQVREGRVARRGQLFDDPVSLAEFAGADSRLRAARAGVHDAVEEAHELAERGAEVDLRLQARTFLACMLASDVAVEATSIAHNLGGGDAAYAGSPLQRALRDVATSRQHLLFAHKHRVEFAKALAGVDVVYPPFLGE